LNKEIIMGVRAEDIYDKLFAQMATPYNTVKLHCEVYEPMGSESYIYLSTGKTSLVARVGANDHPPVNQSMDIVFDMRKAHFFDPSTEDAIL